MKSSNKLYTLTLKNVQAVSQKKTSMSGTLTVSSAVQVVGRWWLTVVCDQLRRDALEIQCRHHWAVACLLIHTRPVTIIILL